jgi:thiamine pyrophosphate-dependent acetolactate synthase large subunit-like protein
VAELARDGGRILVDQLLLNGIDTMFCVPGESFLVVAIGTRLDELTTAGYRLLEHHDDDQPTPDQSRAERGTVTTMVARLISGVAPSRLA